jgi:uncharacterized OB-fold protein
LGPAEQYQQHLASGVIKLQQCKKCDSHIFYPRFLCTVCGSLDLAWQQISGEGEVYSSTITRRRPDRGGDFNVSLVQLREGPRLMTRVENIDPNLVIIGMKVQARIVDDGEGGYFLVFDPLGGLVHE